MSDLGYRNKTQGRLSIRANSLAEYLAGMRSAVTTEEPRYAAIGVVVDGEYRQLNANILQIENEYYSTIRPKPSKASKSRPLVALRRTRHRLRRGAHARLEQRRSRRHEPKRAALHRSAADLLPAWPRARRSRQQSRPRSMRAISRSRAKAVGPGSSSSTAGASDPCASAAASCSTASARSPSCSTPTRRATSRRSTPQPRRCATPSGRRRRRYSRLCAASRPAFSSTRSSSRGATRPIFATSRSPPTREQALAETARRSLEEAEALASQDPRPFAGLPRGLFRAGLEAGGRRRSFFVIPLTARRACGADTAALGHSGRA